MTARTNSSTGSRSFRSPRTSSGFTRVRHTCLSKASIVRPWPTNSPPLASPVFQVGWFNSVTSISKRSSTLSLFSSAWQPHEGRAEPAAPVVKPTFEPAHATRTLREVGLQRARNAALVRGRERADLPRQQPVVEREDLQPDDTGQRQPGRFEVLYLAVTWPRPVSAGCDHREHGVASRVECSTAQNESWPSLRPGSPGEWKWDDDDGPWLTNHGMPCRRRRSPTPRASLRGPSGRPRRMARRAEGLLSHPSSHTQRDLRPRGEAPHGFGAEWGPGPC